MTKKVLGGERALDGCSLYWWVELGHTHRTWAPLILSYSDIMIMDTCEHLFMIYASWTDRLPCLSVGVFRHRAHISGGGSHLRGSCEHVRTPGRIISLFSILWCICEASVFCHPEPSEYLFTHERDDARVESQSCVVDGWVLYTHA